MTNFQAPNNDQYSIINNQTHQFGYCPGHGIPLLRENLVIEICLVIVSWLLVISPNCFAADIAFEATVDKNIVSLGGSVQLSLTFQGSTDVPAPELQEPEGFTARYLGPSTMMSIVNGKMSSSITHIYVLVPLKTGKFAIGPFSAEYKGQKYMSQPINIEVVDQPVQQQKPPAAPAGSAVTEEQLKDRIFVELAPVDKDVYLNQIIPVIVRLHINKLAIKDIEYPQVAADGFSKEQFAKPDQYQKAAYDVIEFKSSAYPLRTGELTLGPAEIKCNLIVRRQQKGQGRPSAFGDFFQDDDFFSDFFTRYETYPLNLKSQAININVKPLPEEGKPSDFTGAVGDFDMHLDADPVNVKAGDPVTIKMRITGTGNFATVNEPFFEPGKDFKTYQPQTKSEPNQKIFEQVVMPLSENVTHIPEALFSFFNPKTGLYRTMRRGPIAITVSKPDQLQQPVTPKIVEAASRPQVFAQEKDEVLGKDIVYIKETPGAVTKGSLYQGRFFMWIFILPFVIFLVLFFIEKRNNRLRTDTRYARQLGALKKAQKGLAKSKHLLNQGKKDDFYNAVFKAMQEYISDRCLKEEIVPQDVSARLKEFFGSCDAVRFALSPATKDDMAKTLRLAKEIIEELEKVKL